ncbi:MPT63 family protein [Mycobacterium sp. smrl_JER01]|uniref:MPT63 family protein n=1 Tax=Mycobacterium sp. smrl_JER01 TaxID=3402633 RepID=UPI003AC10950
MTPFGKVLVALAGGAVVGVAVAPVASAEDSTIHHFGSAAEIVNGSVVQEWTISGLRPSEDAIPHRVVGTLWEAAATDTAVQGSVVPMVPNFNARARNGQTYRVLWGAATPEGVNPSVLGQGEKATGKVYFDVTGEAPESVVYSAGGTDLAVWVQPPPAPARSAPSSGVSAGSGAGSSGAAEDASAESAEAGDENESAVDGVGAEVSVPGGSQGTPLDDEASRGASVPLSDSEAESTPEVAADTTRVGTQSAAHGSGAPAGPSQGTPLPTANHGTSVASVQPGS